MEVRKIVLHSILEIFHFIPFWHLSYSIPKYSFYSIPFSIPYHALVETKNKTTENLFLRPTAVIYSKGLEIGIPISVSCKAAPESVNEMFLLHFLTHIEQTMQYHYKN